jgi:hypothetical protein
MSRVERKTHKLKLIGRTWTPWKEITITGEIRNSAPHMRKISHIWANSRFEVHGWEVPSTEGGIVQLLISRHGQLDAISWNDVMRIKHEIFGDSGFAIEIYPPENVTTDMKVRIVWVMPKGWTPPCGLHLDSAWGGLK